MRHEVSTADELRAIVGVPNEYVANKVKNRLSPLQRDWLAASPSVSQIAKSLTRTDVSLAELDEYYSEDNIRKLLSVLTRFAEQRSCAASSAIP